MFAHLHRYSHVSNRAADARIATVLTDIATCFAICGKDDFCITKHDDVTFAGGLYHTAVLLLTSGEQDLKSRSISAALLCFSMMPFRLIFTLLQQQTRSFSKCADFT